MIQREVFSAVHPVVFSLFALSEGPADRALRARVAAMRGTTLAHMEVTPDLRLDAPLLPLPLPLPLADPKAGGSANASKIARDTAGRSAPTAQEQELQLAPTSTPTPTPQQQLANSRRAYGGAIEQLKGLPRCVCPSEKVVGRGGREEGRAVSSSFFFFFLFLFRFFLL